MDKETDVTIIRQSPSKIVITSSEDVSLSPLPKFSKNSSVAAPLLTRAPSSPAFRRAPSKATPKCITGHKFFRNYVTIAIYALFLLYFLFANDARLYGLTDPSKDSYFSAFNVLAFIFFSVYFVYFLATEEGYWKSIFAASDVFILAIVILDIPEVRSAISASDTTQHKWLSRIFMFLFGTARLAVVNKFIQLWFLQKHFREFDEESLAEEGALRRNPGNGPNIRQLVSQTTTINLVLLLMLWVFFLFNPDLFPSISSDFAPTLNAISELAMRSPEEALSYLSTSLPLLFSTHSESLVYAQFPNNVSFTYQNITQFRQEELFGYAIPKPAVAADLTLPGLPNTIQLILSTRQATHLESLLLIVRNLLILLLSALFVAYNHWVYKRYIFEPYKRLNERMVFHQNRFAQPEETPNTDCFVIESESMRIKRILIRGFGKAAEALLTRLYSLESKLDFDAFKNTREVYAIFGFCDIRRFTDVSETMGRNVINFVNSVAEIVHAEVDAAGGAPNKNVGDAFLVVWTLEADDSNVAYLTSADADPGQVQLLTKAASLTRSNLRSEGDEMLGLLERAERLRCYKIDQKNAKTAEAALICLLKIIVKLATSEEIAQINNDPIIKARLPDFSVKIGFGLHAGKAIEGGLGSFYKLDMAYIGRSTSMSMLLESLTKEYKVGLLLSQTVVNLMMSERVIGLCREVRSLQLIPLSVTYRLYTVDMPGKPEPEQPSARVQAYGLSLNDCRAKWNTNWEFAEVSEIDSSWERVLEDPQLVNMLGLNCSPQQKSQRRRNLDANQAAIKAYIEGNWEEARSHFQSITELTPDQLAIVEEMNRYSFTCPFNYPTVKMVEI